MNDMDERWSSGLRAEAVMIELPTVAPEPLMRRAARRRHRRRAVAAVLGAGTLVASGLAWQANRSDHDRAARLVIADEPDSGSTAGVADTALPGVANAPTVTAPRDAFRFVDPSTLPDVTLGDTGLRWTAHDVRFGQGLSNVYGTGLHVGDGALVAVSTAPGSKPTDEPVASVYTSTDGVTWSSRALNGSHWFGDITSVGSRLVAVGTAAVNGAVAPGDGVGDLVVSTSDDSGTSWHDIVLPLDLRAVRDKLKTAGVSGRVSVGGAQVAVGPGGTVVAVWPRLDLTDPAKLLPAGVDTAGGFVTVTEGVAVFAKPSDPDQASLAGCQYGGGTCDPSVVQRLGDKVRSYRPVVAHVYTWSELGLDAQVASLLAGDAFVFRSSDGVHFTAAAAPDRSGLVGAVFDGSLMATGDGYTMTMTANGCCTADQVVAGRNAVASASAVWRSTDLASWERMDPLPLDPPGYGSRAFGELDGRLVAAGSVGMYPAVAVADGTHWTTTLLGKALATKGSSSNPGTATVGPAGVAIVSYLSPDPWASSGLAVHDGGLTLRVDGQQLGYSVVDDATGTVLAHLGDLYSPVANAKVGITLDGTVADASGGSPTTVTGTVPPVSAPVTTTAVARIDATTAVFVGGAATTVPATSSSDYVVQSGDVASAIATSRGVSLGELQKVNADVDLEHIVPGQVLHVPTETPPAYGGPSTMTVTDVASGRTLATFALAAFQAQLQQLMNATDFTHPLAKLLFSRDARTWSVTDLGEVAAGPVTSVANLAVTASGVVATVSIDEKDPNAPKATNGEPAVMRQRALVATLG